MKLDFPAIAFITINAPRSNVWAALTDTEVIKQYMLGTAVEADWKVGGSLVRQEEGRPVDEIGEILAFEPEQLLEFSCFDSNRGSSDPMEPHNVTIVLTTKSRQTRVAVIQDNNLNDEVRSEAERRWTKILAGLKNYVEVNLPQTI
jgi:uncharacterized protein YndB with AHSA1/START domain